MTLWFLLATVAQGLALTALALLIGGLTLDALLPLRLTELAPARKLLRDCVIGATAALLLTSAAELVIRARTMAGGDVASALGAVPTVLARTHFGRIWIGRGAALVLAWVLVVRRARVLALLLGAVVALTTALTGHAADRGDLSLSVALDWVHVLAASAWTGGLICLGIVLRARARAWSISALARAMAAFSRLAGWCLLAVVVTGGYNAWSELPGPRGLWTTGYGRVLGLKLLLVAALVWWGALNRYTVLPRLAGRGTALGEPQPSPVGRLVARGASRAAGREPAAALAAYLRREAILALAVFGCTAVLVNSEPPHRGAHEHHPMEPHARAAGERVRLPGCALAAHGERDTSLHDVAVHGQDAVPHRVAARLEP